MAADDESDSSPEGEMLPDERTVIAERASDLDELEDDDFLSVDELAERLDLDRD